MEKKEFLKNSLIGFKSVLTEDKLDKLITYYEMIVKKNEVMNLTAITDFDEFVVKHYLDCLQIQRVFDLNGKKLSLIDVGTGAGFPGIPLKIMYPDLSVTLFDSLQKRISFLDEVIAELDLKNIITVHGRAEEFGRKEDFREKFDLVVSRAVAELTSLCEISIPFCKVGGSFVSYKGSKGKDELKQAEYCIKTLGCKISNTDSFKLNNFDAEEYNRTLIEIVKIKSTDNKYPRGGGKPFKSPLHIV